MTLWARVYEHNDFNGRSGYMGLLYGTPARTYGQFTKSWFDSVHLHDRVSSVRSGASGWEQGGWLYLFQHDHYRGRFARFWCSPGATHETHSLGSQNMNDRATTGLLIRQFSSQLPPIALGNFGTPSLRDQIETFVGAIPRIRMRGDVVVTWDMWPSFSASRKYVYIRVPVRVDVPNWFDYDAEIRLWVYLYLDQNGKVRGFLNWYGAWVEGGILTGKILDRIMGALPGQVGTINNLIASSLSGLDALSFVRLYYLPGTGNGATGHTDDDVSIVLVKRL